MASQAIGEPGTQLTLRTFHSGGVVGSDITRGLPRVEEIFERRIPKIPALVSKVSGEVLSVKREDKSIFIEILKDSSGTNSSKKTTTLEVSNRRYLYPHIKKGVRVEKGDILTDGSVNLKELLKYAGKETTERYMIREILKVYELQGAPVSPKHFEIIIDKMFSRCTIKSSGDGGVTEGEVMEIVDVEEINEKLKEEGKDPVVYERLLLGITEVSLTADSWLSSSSFQHTTRMLIANAVKGNSDVLHGLNENVIIGNLIPAGTGFNKEFIELPEEEIIEEEAEDASTEEKTEDAVPA
jgi:DNA-directed RNA polymerase subunit beta'